MCLGVPGRITRKWEEGGAILAAADFVGEERIIRLNYLPDLTVGDYTIVHAGFALTHLSEQDALSTIELMQSVGLLEEETAS